MATLVVASARLMPQHGVVFNPVPPISLPMVPWEGGPAYWANFTQTTAAGWTNPRFFPIGTFAYPVTAQGDIDSDKAAGVNNYVLISQGSTMSLLRTNGVWAQSGNTFVGTFPSGMGSETTGYFVNDEAELFWGVGSNGWNGDQTNRSTSGCIPGGSNCGYTVMSGSVGQLPDTMHAKSANWSWDVLLMATASAQAFVRPYTNMEESVDIYWYADNSPCAGAIGGQIILGNPSTGLSGTQCHRSSNYGVVVKQLQALMSPLQPVWGFVDDWTKDNTPTGVQIQGAAWNAIINEARGIIFFAINNPSGPQEYTLRTNSNGNVPSIAALANQIGVLAPAINTQSFVWNFNSNINSMLKFSPDGFWYIFAMQAGFNNSGTYTFTLPTSFTSSSSANVVFESRTVPISAGSFSDTFSNEYSYHIYQIHP